ncbi:MAG: hypothetical protein KGQ59_12125 [Bdellovibrionales bacterium]|nr:hypothetical protein [Bdellovibrionales bacterium]
MNDMNSFLQSESRTPPAIILERLKPIIEVDLRPKKTRVALKVSLIHLIASVASLLICPQFGVSPLGGDTGVMTFLMNWGWAACAAGCGAIFMTGTGSLTALLLNPDEKRVFGNLQGWTFSALAVVSWATLMAIMPTHSTHQMTSEESIATYSAAWNFVWIAAAVGSSLLCFRVLKAVRVLAH